MLLSTTSLVLTVAEIVPNSSGTDPGNTVNSYPRQLFLWAKQKKIRTSAPGPLICASLPQRYKDVVPLTAKFKGIIDFFFLFKVRTLGSKQQILNITSYTFNVTSHTASSLRSSKQTNTEKMDACKMFCLWMYGFIS